MLIQEQVIRDIEGQPLFAVLPYKNYIELVKQAKAETAPQEDIQRFVRLPYGGPGARLDVLRLVEFMLREGIDEMPINQRAQAYDKFPQEQLLTLDPLIRRYFLKEDSPYINTMQATSEVIDALERMELFERSQIKTAIFSRTVNSIKINIAKAKEFMEKFPALTVNERLLIKRSFV